MSSHLQLETAEPPPPYASCVEAAISPQEPPSAKDHLREDLLENIDDALPTTESPPPPFSLTPGTLILAPHALTIHSPVAGARASYQLSRPLNGHITATTLLEVRATRRLNADGTLRTVRPRDKLYCVSPARWPEAATALVTGQHDDDQFGDVRLRRCHGGLGLKKHNFEVFSADEERHLRVLYQAKGKKGVIEWHDGGGTLVAVETPAVDRKMEEERLEIMISLDKKHLDLIVALWVGRIFLDSQQEGAREDVADARRRKAAQRELDKEEGRPHGVWHDVKEALGIGYGLKPGPRSPGMYGGPPTIKQNGRIAWS